MEHPGDTELLGAMVEDDVTRGPNEVRSMWSFVPCWFTRANVVSTACQGWVAVQTISAAAMVSFCLNQAAFNLLQSVDILRVVTQQLPFFLQVVEKIVRRRRSIRALVAEAA